jgi:hypothetical protein
MTSTRQVIDIQDILKALSAQGLHLRAVGYFAATDGNTNSRISSEFRFEELLPLLLSYLFDCIETNPHSADDSFLHSRGEAFFELPYILNIARKQTDSTLCVGLFWDWIEIKLVTSCDRYMDEFVTHFLESVTSDGDFKRRRRLWEKHDVLKRYVKGL